MQQRNFPRMGGAGLNPRIGLPRATPINNRRGATIKFLASSIWKAPAGVRKVSSIRGIGTVVFYLNVYRTITRYRAFGDGGSQTATNGPTRIVHAEIAEGDSIPDDFCETEPGDNWSGIAWDTMETCYTYSTEIVNTNATALGKAFPGGAIKTFSNVDIIPGTTYTINVPNGGFIEITYN